MALFPQSLLLFWTQTADFVMTTAVAMVMVVVVVVVF